MRILTDLFDSQNRQDTLLVLLPPAESSIEDFISHGFVEAVRSRQIRTDILLAEVTHQHVMSKTIVSALHEHVMLPALASGYKKIWFAGISLAHSTPFSTPLNMQNISRGFISLRLTRALVTFLQKSSRRVARLNGRIPSPPIGMMNGHGGTGFRKSPPLGYGSHQSILVQALKTASCADSAYWPNCYPARMCA
ncbi:MAG: hypothetical protein ACOH1I_04930 [Gallionellaceae bacterium]